MASITAIEGIAARYRERLAAADVKTCEKLLEAGATRKGRRQLAETCGLSEKRVLEWVNRADLLRIRGVSTQYSDLLEAANNRRKNKLVRQMPVIGQVERWVSEAKTLQIIVK